MAGVKRVNQNVTSFRTPITSSCVAGLADDNGLVVLAFFDSSKCTIPPLTAGIYAPGCLFFNSAGTSTTTGLFANAGTTASPSIVLVTMS